MQLITSKDLITYDLDLMQEALNEAKKSMEQGFGGPIGALLAEENGKICQNQKDFDNMKSS